MLHLLPPLLLSTALSAAPLRPYAAYGRVVNAVTLDAASSTFSIDLAPAEINGTWDIMTVWIKVTTDADNSVTAITMTCTSSRDNGTTDFVLQFCTTSSGVCTSTDTSWVKNPSSMTNKAWPWRIDIAGLPEVECTITDTGGTSSDVMSVWVTFGQKG